MGATGWEVLRCLVRKLGFALDSLLQIATVDGMHTLRLKLGQHDISRRYVRQRLLNDAGVSLAPPTSVQGDMFCEMFVRFVRLQHPICA